MMPVSVQRATTRPSAPPSAASSADSVSSCRTSCQRLAPIDSRTAISLARAAPRASSRLAMLAQAISSTNAVTPSSSVSGGCARRRAMLLWPRAPGSTVTGLALKRAIVASLMPFCSGASTSLTMARYGTLTAALACSIVTPGFSRANR